MKGLIFAALCFALAAPAPQALEEAYLTFGPSWQNLFNASGDASQLRWGRNGLAGLTANAYGFWNGSNAGLFVLSNILVSVYVTDMRDRDSILSYGSLVIQEVLGPAFRRELAPNLTLLGGLGLDFYTHTVRVAYRSGQRRKTESLNLGAAVQAAIKFDLTGVLCLSLGVNAGYTFVRYTEELAGWEITSNIALNPFVGFGFNRHDYKYWGKPEPAGEP